jgi:hypothetical protein
MTEGYGDTENTDVEETETTESTEAPAEESTSKSKRVGVPEGWITPIGFRNALEDSGRVGSDFKPQMVYAYVNNPGKANPFPVKWTDGSDIYETREEAGENGRPVLQESEGFSWWDEKEARKTQRAEKKATEDSEPMKKATTTSKGKRGKKQETVEVVEDEAGTADDVE